MYKMHFFYEYSSLGSAWKITLLKNSKFKAKIAYDLN